MNILLLGAGRRVSLIERFITKKFYPAIYELDTHVPASYIAATPLFKSEQEACEKYPWYLACMDKLTTLGYPNYIGSDQATSVICYDKKQFESFMIANYPEFYPSIDDSNSYIIKPRFGNSSKGIRQTNCILNLNQHEVAQKYIDGQEYSVDCYFSRDNKWIGGVSRVRERVAGGEVIDSTVVMNSQILELTKTIGEQLKMRGPACFQFFLTRDNMLYIFEINARCGGGIILSIEAGLDIVEYIKQEYYLEKNIKPIDNSIIIDGLMMRRVNREFFFNYE